ncbi:radical SAM protein [bacterium]|nr:radical SAM protein [bacterium]
MIRKHYKEVKKVLRKGSHLDTYFVSKYSFSPYMACQHGCKYCDGRAECYYVEGDFEKDIVVRRNTAEQLDQDLAKERDWGVILVGSGISDAYQPCELDEKIMTETLKVLIKYRYPLFIITKSANILRDLDLLTELNQVAGVTVSSSLTFPDDTHRKIIEPNASSIEERVNSLKILKDRGIAIGITAMPILPQIVDNAVDLERLFDSYSSLKASFVLPGGLTLRPGKNKTIFMNILKENYPQYLEIYEKMYSRDFTSGSPLREFSNPFYARVYQQMEKRGLNDSIPYQIYKDRFPIYEVVYIYLKHLKHRYRNHQDIRRLLESYQRYKDWYLDFKNKMSISKKITYHTLEEEFFFLLETGVIEQFIDNSTLYEHILGRIKEIERIR